MNLYRDEPEHEHGRTPSIGILLTNLGTPEKPTAAALRRYLKEFLWDTRVVERPRIQWWLILHLFVLTRRPHRSAALYRKIWTEEGSPLLTISRRVTDSVRVLLRQEIEDPIDVALGMRYGQPSIPKALNKLGQKGCTRLLCLPLFPQYSAVTTASTFDALAAELTTWRVIPELRTIHQYHDEPAYIEALSASVRESWAQTGEPDRLLFSFHGIPLRYFRAGDPYPHQCHKTARLAAEALELPESRYEVAFQSIFGKEEWVKPTTSVTVEAMARSGIKKLDMICPGFSVDCLETLEEIDQLNRKLFLDNGGERFTYISCLNDRPDHLRTLADLIKRNIADWVTAS